MRPISRRQFLGFSFVSPAVLSGIGCGTVLHPERRGQPAGPLDWSIVALDAVGLLLFFVPGVIAFAVDFSNGTIYLPPERYGRRFGKGRRDQLVTLKLPDQRATLPEIEALVSKHAQQEIRLKTGTYQTRELGDIAEFWDTADQLNQVG